MRLFDQAFDDDLWRLFALASQLFQRSISVVRKVNGVRHIEASNVRSNQQGVT